MESVEPNPDIQSNLLLRKQIELMVDMQIKKLASEMNAELNNIRAELRSFASEAQAIKTHMSNLQKAQNLLKETKAQQLSSDPQTKLREESKPDSSEKGLNKELTPDNVSIDKIFYCGKKK